jgi:hypothetical protein
VQVGQHYGRPLSEADTYAIVERLPLDVGFDDVIEAAADLGIGPFAGGGPDASRSQRRNRIDYMNDLADERGTT